MVRNGHRVILLGVGLTCLNQLKFDIIGTLTKYLILRCIRINYIVFLFIFYFRNGEEIGLAYEGFIVPQEGISPALTLSDSSNGNAEICVCESDLTHIEHVWFITRIDIFSCSMITLLNLPLFSGVLFIIFRFVHFRRNVVH